MASRAPASAPSGLLLRLPPGLHAALRAAAEAAGLSLNEYCVRRLAAPGGFFAIDPDAAAAVERAADLVGDRLVAVVVYGSWPAGQAVASSDVDLLVAVDQAVALTRALYRRWDDAPVRWRGRLVDPHFVHVPAEGDPVSPLWAEVAVTGMVLFERDDRVSRHLMRARQGIAEGRLVRRIAHGQPYWVSA